MPKFRMTVMRFLKYPKLRLYQQIIITFILVVMLPLTGVSLIIYNINQKALKKELIKFTEHTAESIYKDITTEMSWQKNQGQMMTRYIGDHLGSRPFETDESRFKSNAAEVFHLADDYEAIGLYNPKGQRVQAIQNQKLLSVVSNESRFYAQSLPEQLSDNQIKNPYEVLYTKQNKTKDDTPYHLRMILPIQKGGYCVFLKRFQYLQNLIRFHQGIYEGFYIINNDGVIVAGPTGVDLQNHQIATEDYRILQSVEPGVAHEYLTPLGSVELVKQKRDKPHSIFSSKKDADDVPMLEKVIVKMPEINWGIVIESPFHVRQQYITRARDQSIFWMIACLVLVILLALVYVFGISRNFRQLIKGIKAMAEGNYFRRIHLITNFFTPYEIIYLTGEFNRMARKRAEAWETLQEANAKLAKLDEMKSNLIDTVSHELRTPLTSIKGYTSRLLRYDSTLDKETRIKSLKVVKQQADRLSRLVEDLLVIPDLEHETLRVFPDEVNLTQTLEQSVQFIQAREHREILVRAEDSLSKESLKVLADPDRLEQVLLNLMDNAVKYSQPETPVYIDIQTSGSEKVRISVANLCDPIPTEELNKLFDKFKRLDESTVRTTRGSGLGLFITKGLVEAMGGEITLNYVEGFFKVSFTIPLYVTSPSLALESP